MLPTPLPDPLVDLVAQRLRIVGQPVRIRLILVLAKGDELSVQSLADEVMITQQNASSHLGLLTREGLLRRRQEGRQAWYALTSPAPARLIQQLAAEIIDELGAGSPRRTQGDG